MNRVIYDTFYQKIFAMTIYEKNKFISPHFSSVMEDSYTQSVIPINFEFDTKTKHQKKILEPNIKRVFNNWLKARPIPNRQTHIWKSKLQKEAKPNNTFRQQMLKDRTKTSYSNKLKNFSISPLKSERTSRKQNYYEKAYALKSIEMPNTQKHLSSFQVKNCESPIEKRLKIPHMHFNMQYFTKAQISSPLSRRSKSGSYFLEQAINQYEQETKRIKQRRNFMSQSSHTSRISKNKVRLYERKKIIFR